MSIIAKYKFDKSIYENLIPTFNDGYTGYTISDVVDSVNSNHIIRTIECDTLPTRIDFGVSGTEEQYTNRSDSLLAIYNLDTSAVTDGGRMVKGCRYVTEINTSDWDTSNMIDMTGMFGYCTNLTSLDLSNFDTSKVTGMSAMFYKCNNLTTIGDVSNWDTSNVISMGVMFYNCSKLPSLDVSNWNTSKVNLMYGMFSYCNKLTSLDVSKWDTSKVTDMKEMFTDCHNLTSLNVSKWDTSKVTDMSSMFNGCNNLTSLDVSNWDTSKVTSMQDVFNNCYSLTSLDVSNFNTSNVTSMWGMFANCQALSNLSCSNFDMTKVTTVYRMFKNLSNLKVLDLTLIEFYADDYQEILLDTNNLEVLKCDKLSTIYKLAKYFPDRTSLESGKLVTSLRNKIPQETLNTLTAKNWQIKDLVAQYRFDANRYENLLPEFNAEFTADKYRVIDEIHELVLDDMIWYDGLLYSDGSPGYSEQYPRAVHSNYFRVTPNIMYTVDFSIDLSKFPGYSGVPSTNIINIHWYDSNKNHIRFLPDASSDMAPSNAVYVRFCTEAQAWDDQGLDLKDCRVSAKLVNRTIESVNGDLPTLMRFGRTYVDGESATDNRTDSLLEVLDMNTSGLTSCSNMFRYCKNLTSITCEWNTSNVTNMGNMFSTCYDLTSLDVSNFNTSNVTSMYSMFNGCISLTSLDLSNWDTSDVNDMAHMFHGCSNLTSLDVSGFNTSNVTNMCYMFHNCSSLTSLDVSGFNTSKVTNMNAMFYKCYELESLNLKKWNTSNVTAIDDFISGFEGTSRLTVIDISNFDLSKVTNIVCHMINNVPNLKYIVCNNVDTMNKQNVLTSIPTRTVENPGLIICNADTTNLDVTTLNSKNWRLATAEDMVTVAQYKFDKSICEDFIPVFNSEFKVYFIDDEYLDIEDLTGMYDGEGNEGYTITADNIVTRTIRVVKGVEMPNSIRFGSRFQDGSEEGRIDNRNKPISIISIDYLNIERLASMYMIFRYCRNMMTINTENWNTTNIPAMSYVFAYCNNLTSLDVSNWDTSNVTTMRKMFQECSKLTSLDVSNFNTSKVTDMESMFYNCKLLTSLDLSNFNTSKVTSMRSMFNNCNNLQEVKLGENFRISPTCNVTDFVTNCNANFIVVDDVATYYIDEPLKKGDKIENRVDGIYHKHTKSKIVLDGSEDESWIIDYCDNDNLTIRFKYNNLYCKKNGYILSDKFTQIPGGTTYNVDIEGIYIESDMQIYIRILKSKLSTIDVTGLKAWLQANPATVVYELAEPTTQQLSPNEALLTCSDNSTVSIDSNVPVQSYQPSKQYVEVVEFINPNTEYLVKFKSDAEGTIDVTLGGNKLANIQIVKGWNNVKIVTLATLTDNNLYIKGKNMNLSDIVVTPYDELFAQQGEYFEGLSSVGQMKRTKNLFDGQLPYIGGLKSNGTTNNETHKHTSNYIEVKPNTKYYWKNHDNISIYRVIGYDKQKQFVEMISDSSSIVEFGFTTSDNVYYIRIGQNTSDITTKAQLEESSTATPYEPYGYKMDISVKGKNLFDGKLELGTLGAKGECLNSTMGIRSTNYIPIKPYVTYVASRDKYNSSISNYVFYRFYDKDFNFLGSTANISIEGDRIDAGMLSSSIRILDNRVAYFKFASVDPDLSVLYQFEEGSIATPYEPHHNITKTIYLQEPLRKGDKIEQVVENGLPVVRIIRNMTEITLDGSESWSFYDTFDNTIRFLSITAYPKCKVESSKIICDKFKYNRGSYDLERIRFRTPSWNTIFLWINKSRLSTHDVDGLKQWLSQNPVTAVYELETPIVNTISLDNLNFDVTANNTLSIDSNVPVQKITFNNLVEKDCPLLVSANYMLQFKADNSGKIWIGLGTNNLKEFDCVKGLNSYIVTTPTTLENNNLTIKGKAIKINDVIVTQSDEIFEVDYYKGVESTFENPYDDGGTTKYKATIKLTGKNKWSFGDIIDKDVVVFENIHIPKGIYKLSGDAPKIYESAPAMRFVYKDGSYERATISSNYTLNFKDDIVRIVFYSNGYNYANSIDKLASATNIQLEEGNVVTPYEPYFEDIKEIDLTTPLFAGDELIAYDDGIYHKHTKIKKVLTGEDVSHTDTSMYMSETSTSILTYAIPNVQLKDFIINNKLPVYKKSKFIWSSKEAKGIDEGMSIVNEIWGFCIRLPHSKTGVLSTDTEDVIKDKFKAYLDENPIEVVCEIEPYEEKVSDNFLYFTVVPKSTITADTRVPFYTMTASYKPDEVESISTIAEIEENIDVTTMIVDDEIIPYIMDMDLLLTEMEMKSDISTVSTFSLITIMDEMGGEDMASMQERTQRMLERIIRCGQYDVQELKDRVILYEDAKRITSEQALELMMLINEIYGA